MKHFIFIACLFLSGMAVLAEPAAAAQDHEQIRKVVAEFVAQQSASLSGKATFRVGNIDHRITLATCARMEAFLPEGNRLIGNTSIGVRCMKRNGWSIFVPAQIKVKLNLLVSARQLPAGHTIRQQDLVSQTNEVTQIEGLSDPRQVIGKVLRFSIAAGQILRENMLRQPFTVTQGQIVHLVVQGDGFSIRSEGAALGNAGEGKNVQVRSGSGRVIGGIAQANGVVEIVP
ncbi:MAG: flagellar basal body P-ring formation chaperone FlgA [Gallionella sp.]